MLVYFSDQAFLVVKYEDLKEKILGKDKEWTAAAEKSFICWKPLQRGGGDLWKAVLQYLQAESRYVHHAVCVYVCMCTYMHVYVYVCMFLYAYEMFVCILGSFVGLLCPSFLFPS